MSFVMAGLALGGCAIAGIGIYAGLSFLKSSGEELNNFFDETCEKEKRYRTYEKVNEEENLENQYTTVVVDDALDNENEDKIISDSDFETIKNVYENIDRSTYTLEQEKEDEAMAYEILENGTTFGILNPIKIIYLSTKYSLEKGFERAKIEMEEEEKEGVSL